MTDVLTEMQNKRDDEILFYSRYGPDSEHTLVRKPIITEVLTGGITRTVATGKRYTFVNGVLKVRAGRDRMVDHEGWLHPSAEQDVERDVVDALKAHHAFNKDFWLAGEEPGRLRPYDEEVLGWMAEAVAALDADRLEALLAEELAGHNRALLVRALRKAHEATTKTRAKLEAEAEAEAARKPATKKAQ